MDYTGKHAAVLGLGRSGEAAARLLLDSGARVTVLDSGEPGPRRTRSVPGAGFQHPSRCHFAACSLVLIIAAVLALALLQQLLDIPALAVAGRLRLLAAWVRIDQCGQLFEVCGLQIVWY